MLKFDRLRISLPGTSSGAESARLTVVRELSLEVGAGETVGLVGESGCGKSMTALAALGLLPPGAQVEGSIRLGSQELLRADETTLRRVRGRGIALVFQNPMTALNPFFSIGQHLDAVLNAHFGAPAAERQRQAARALERVELKQSMAGRYPHQLSGGQLQRVMLALAVACQPQVLIADEPTTALDVTLQAKLMDLLHSLTLEGMGLLLISHDLALVAQCADRVAVMYAGEAVERGSAAQVLSRAAHPYTQALLNSQPRLGAGRMQLATLPGQVARAEDGDAACAFALRCGRAQVLCFSAAPAFIRCAPEHSARCHFAGPLPQEGPAK